MKLPKVALIGRPNVGKSTIFNRIVGRKVSIIEDTPGVTRDRIYGQANYQDYRFSVIDTGGIDLSEETFNEEIKVQASLAIENSDTILFIVDGKEGLTQNDLAIRDLLRKANKRIIVVINKIDSKAAHDHRYDFYELGFDEYIEVSAEQNMGFIELMDMLVMDFKKQQVDEEEDTRLKLAVIGRPNVGKSSLVNALLNEDRVIVSDVAGTT